MKFFKNPVVAIILALIVVYASTLLAFDVRFGNKCQEVADGFQNGVYYNGEFQPSCASRLRTVTGYADEIKSIASANDIDTEVLTEAVDSLKSALRYSAVDASFVYYCYNELDTALTGIKAQLHRAELSDVFEAELSQLYTAIDDEIAAIDTSGYNESVSDFLREYDKFPVSYFYWRTNVLMPSYFA